MRLSRWLGTGIRLCLALILTFLFLSSSPARAVDALAYTTESYFSRITWDWTADGSGNATGQTTLNLPGLIYAAITVPDTGTPPTDNYDIVVKQAFDKAGGSQVVMSTDLAGGALADRDTANTEQVSIWPTISQCNGHLRLEVTNAGAGGKGRIYILVYRTLTYGTVTIVPGDLQLTGDATAGPGASPLAVTVVDDSHAHTKTTLPNVEALATGGSSGYAPVSSGGGVLSMVDVVLNSELPLADANVADNLTISGGTINNTVIGASTSAYGTFSGVTAKGNLLVGDSSAGSSRYITLRALAGYDRAIEFDSGVIKRWIIMGADTATESGSDAGSNFRLYCYKDDGSFLAQVINIVRASGGAITFYRNLVLNASDLSVQGGDITTTTGVDLTIAPNGGDTNITGTLSTSGDLSVNGGDINTVSGGLTIAPNSAVTSVTGQLDVSTTIKAGSSDITLTNAAGYVQPGSIASGTDKYILGYSTSTYAAWKVPKTKAIVLTAAGATPSTTQGATGPTKYEYGTNDIDTMVMEFADGSVAADDDYCFWNAILPDDYDGGTLAVTFYWTCAAGSAGDRVLWQIDARSLSNDDAFDGTYGTAVPATGYDAVIAVGDLHTITSGTALTIGNTPSAGDWVTFRVRRKVSDTTNDTLAQTARLLSVKLEYTPIPY